MAIANGSIQINVGGIVQRWTMDSTSDALSLWEPFVAIATAASDWTYSTGSTGTVTLTEGHGLTTGTFDIYWEGGYRAGVSATITLNAMAVTGGAGSNYPATHTAMTVCKQEAVDVVFDGSKAVVIAASSPSRSLLSLTDGYSTTTYELSPTQGLLIAPATLDVANPLVAATIDSATVSTGDSTGSSYNESGTAGAVVTLAMIYDSTP